MKVANILMSAIHLLIVILIFAIGSFFVALYFYQNILFDFVNRAVEKPDLFLTMGLFTIFLAIVLFAFFYFVNKGQYMKFIMGKNKFHIDAMLIKTYIEKYLQTTYPGKKNKFEVYILPENKLEIVANVSSLDNQKDFLLNAEKKISKLLYENFDYENDFIFTLKSKR